MTLLRHVEMYNDDDYAELVFWNLKQILREIWFRQNFEGGMERFQWGVVCDQFKNLQVVQ